MINVLQLGNQKNNLRKQRNMALSLELTHKTPSEINRSWYQIRLLNPKGQWLMMLGLGLTVNLAFFLIPPCLATLSDCLNCSSPCSWCELSWSLPPCQLTYTHDLLSVDGAFDNVTRDLFTATLAGNECFNIGWLSAVSSLTLLLMTDSLSVDIDLLTRGDGDPCP